MHMRIVERCILAYSDCYLLVLRDLEDLTEENGQKLRQVAEFNKSIDDYSRNMANQLKLNNDLNGEIIQQRQKEQSLTMQVENLKKKKNFHVISQFKKNSTII